MSTHENPVARQRHGEVTESICKKQKRHYHGLDEVQVFLLALSPLWAVLLLAIYLRAR